jgi:hypothetical protein
VEIMKVRMYINGRIFNEGNTTCNFVGDRRSPEDFGGCMVYLRVHTSNILKLLRITGTNISLDGINKRDKKIVKRAA